MRAVAACHSVAFFGPQGVIVGVRAHMRHMTALPAWLDGDCPLGLGESAVRRGFDGARAIAFVGLSGGLASRRVRA